MKLILRDKEKDYIVTGNSIPIGSPLSIGDREYYVGATKYEIVGDEMVGLVSIKELQK